MPPPAPQLKTILYFTGVPCSSPGGLLLAGSPAHLLPHNPTSRSALHRQLPLSCRTWVCLLLHRVSLSELKLMSGRRDHCLPVPRARATFPHTVPATTGIAFLFYVFKRDPSGKAHLPRLPSSPSFLGLPSTRTPPESSRQGFQFCTKEPRPEALTPASCLLRVHPAFSLKLDCPEVQSLRLLPAPSLCPSPCSLPSPPISFFPLHLRADRCVTLFLCS